MIRPRPAGGKPPLSVDVQFAMLLVTFLIGAAIGLAYDVYRGLRRAAQSGRVATLLGDIIFWAAATILVFRGLVFGNGGELRLYVFVGAAAGLYLYFRMASQTLLWAMTWFWRTIIAFFRLIWLGWVALVRLAGRALRAVGLGLAAAGIAAFGGLRALAGFIRARLPIPGRPSDRA